MIVLDRAEVRRRLDHLTCIALMREAMIALATGKSKQLLRGIIDLDGGNAFGVMPGALEGAGFGAKLVSVFPLEEHSHQGVIVLFDEASGAPAAVIDAGEVTAIRTACASAAATDALALPDAHTLAILGTGEQAWQHALAVPLVRPIDTVRLWGRAPDKAQALARRIEGGLGIATTVAASAAKAVADAAIVCTTTAAAEPVLHSSDVADGTHINLVGSSRAGPVEIDSALVARARFIPDHREGVLAQGAEFLRARAAGLVTDAHVLSEIGTVFAGASAGRLGPADVTIYKSLGSIVQDLACASFLLDGFGG
ncbi:ornithine cyclodeaminase family protein [Sphingomonas sp. MAH-20]|jgi:ornithine cyclodeaminase|uniref:Ornithine cyclodeaminase family protein n=1 Tax=Sphingomonas horti TaxID=2682842 RepID=A0A6I4J3G1_9SPHN|nr:MULTISPECIES: ornithine cyclodeaminase family protein [Sphingomonas]MBA2920010.1 ornithine cyclodeaminase family protein [Sphingomonas sp. CGMCC 1.13658]MVO77891.1 ornithine cyclodeaminase family protein [Sphingomonas horti]